MAHDIFKVGDLTAIIGDNAAQEPHMAGLNGIWSLVHRTDTGSLFTPATAGLNHEHIFDGDKCDGSGDRKIFFEPRHAPMAFKKLSDSEAELHQPPTPTFHLESWTRFVLKPPHYVDMTYRCKPAQHAFNNGYIGLFWASYINAPDDRSMYFRNNGNWQQLCTQAHNDESTVRHKTDMLELKYRKGIGPALFQNFSPLRFDEPFFYGLVRNHLAIFVFDRTEGIRFTHSPSGGGSNRELQTSNPAWDFQYVLAKYEVNKEYGFRVRLAYRERCSRAEVLQEVERMKKTD